jgi:hypothetical protein
MRWPWQRANPSPDVLTLDDIVSADPATIRAITGAPPTPEVGSWRIEKDPHAEKYDCDRFRVGFPRYEIVSPYSLSGLANAYAPRWITEHTADTEEAARQWIADEQKRPIIVAEIPAKPQAMAGGEHDEPITDASLKPGMNP